MTAVANESSSKTVFNVPNQVTALHLILAIVVFSLIPWKHYLAAMIVFTIAASTDWVDGYWARKYGQVTKFGRIFDPFVDKIIICGVFIYLAAEPASRIYPWMAVVVVGRELLVTALRGLVEQSGGDFSANWPAKWKMVFQCIAAAASLLICGWGRPTIPGFIAYVHWGSVWLAIGLTIYSGAIYVQAAITALRNAPDTAPEPGAK